MPNSEIIHSYPGKFNRLDGRHPVPHATTQQFTDRVPPMVLRYPLREEESFRIFGKREFRQSGTQFLEIPKWSKHGNLDKSSEGVDNGRPRCRIAVSVSTGKVRGSAMTIPEAPHSNSNADTRSTARKVIFKVE